MKLISVLSVAIVIGLASAASAQVNAICEGPTTVNSTVSGELFRYIISLDNQGVGNITGFDVQLTSTGNNTHQVQLFNDPDGVPTPFEDGLGLNTAARQAIDTHLLFSGAELLAAGNDATEPALQGDTANDGAVRMQGFVGPGVVFDSNAQGIVGASQANQLEVLQVVLRPGTIVTLTGLVSIAGETTPRVIGPMGPCIPEPCALGLLTMCGVVAMRRSAN